MRTVIFNQGFNRVEHYQIINLERSKLNRLLDEERRLTETLTDSAKRKIEIKPQILPSLEMFWNKIENNDLMRKIRRRIDCLTDAYPQFLHQVAAFRARLQAKVFDILECARFAAQRASLLNRSTTASGSAL